MQKEYVETIANKIIDAKRNANQAPLVATYFEIWEIIKEEKNETEIIREEIIECMRQIHREGKLKGGNAVNKMPLLRPA